MIDTENLRREYGGRVALHGLTLGLAAGDIVGFLVAMTAGTSTRYVSASRRRSAISSFRS